MKQQLEQFPATVVRHLQKAPWRPRHRRPVSLTTSVGISLTHTESRLASQVAAPFVELRKRTASMPGRVRMNFRRWRLCRFPFDGIQTALPRDIIPQALSGATAEPFVGHTRAAWLHSWWLLIHNPDLSPELTQLTSTQANATESSDYPRPAIIRLFVRQIRQVPF